MRVLQYWTVNVLLLVILLFNFTICDIVDEDSETENEVLGTPNYDRLDEIRKACSSVISSATELKIDDNVIGRIKDELFFNNGDWEQEQGSAPLMPFDDRPMSMSSVFDYDLYNSSHLRLPYKLVSFKLTDVSTAHRSKRTVAVNGYLYMVITSDLPLAIKPRKQMLEFGMWRGHSQLLISLQGIYAESKKNGGERKLCLLGSTMLPSRQPDSSDPWESVEGSGSGDKQPNLLQDEQILLVLTIPKKASLQHRAIQGEMRSLNSRSSLKYFDRVQITSLLKANTQDYEFSSDEVIAKACNSNLYSDNSISADIEVYKGIDFCSAFKKASTDAAFIVAPHWRCNGTDEFCSKFGPFASDKQINATDGSFKNVRILVHNILCVTKKTQDSGVEARVSAVFRAFDAPNNQFIEYQRAGLGNMTLVAEGIWNSSNGQLCMIGCLGIVGVEGDHCNSRICVYIPLSFSIKQRSTLLGSISSTEKNNPPYFPLSLEMLQSLDSVYNSYKYATPYYHYSKINDAGAILEKYEPFSFRTVIKKSLLTYPKLQDSDDYPESLRLLAEDLTLHVSAVPDPIPTFQLSRTNVEMEVLSLGPMFGREWFSNDSIASDETPYHMKASYTEKQLLLNVSTQLRLWGGPYSNFSMLFLEGIYDQHVGRMFLIGCRDVRASWRVLYESMDLEGGFDCLIEAVISYPPTTAQWLVTPTASISISSKRTEDDPLYFKPMKLLTLPLLYRQQRVDILSRSGFEGILKILTLSIAIACILSQVFYTRNASDALPYMSLVMLGSQVIGYALPLVIGVQALSRNNNLEDSESSSYDLERSQWITVIDYIVKLLVLACLILTLRLCQKVWNSRVSLLSHYPNEALRVPTEKRVLVITVIVHIVGYIFALISHSLKTGQTPTWRQQYVDTTGSPHTLKTWETLFQEYIGLLQDLFLLPQIIGNIIWQINTKPLRKLYYMGITVVRLLPHVYDFIRGPVSNPYFSEDYEFVNRRFDFYSEFGDIAIPVLAVGLAVIVYIQQRWNYEKLINTLALGKNILPFRSKKYERLPSVPVEAELVSATNKRNDIKRLKSDN